MATSRSLFSTAHSVAVAVILVVSTVAVAFADIVVSAARWCGSAFEAVVLRAPKPIEVGVLQPSRPAVLLVQMRALVRRLAKRDRPVLTASWRMCPSI